jgi:hypothetical protein
MPKLSYMKLYYLNISIPICYLFMHLFIHLL